VRFLERWLTSLAVRLALLVGLLGILSAGVVGVAVVRQSQTTLRDGLTREGLASADLAAASADDFLRNSHEDVRELASQTSVRDLASAGAADSLRAELERWRSDHPWAQSVMVIDLSGRAVARAGAAAPPSDLGAQDWWWPAAGPSGEAIGEARPNTSDGQLVAPYAVPIRDRSGAPTAIVVACARLDILSDRLRDARQLAPGDANTITLGLVDRATGLILASNDPSIVQASIPAERMAEMDSHVNGRGSAELRFGTVPPLLVSIAPVSTLRWTAFARQPVSAAFAPADLLSRQASLLVLASALLAGLAGAGLGLWINRPLRRLRAVADALAAGDLGQRVGLTRSDEIGQVGRAFDRMAGELHTNLEQLEAVALQANELAVIAQVREERARALMDSVGDGILTFDAAGTITSGNPAAMRIFGCSAGEVVGANLSHLVPVLAERVEAGAQHVVAEALLGESGEVEGRRVSGEVFPMELTVSEMPAEDERLFIAVVRDVTERKTVERELTRLAFHDPLTNLPNRSLFMDRLQHALERANRHAAPIAVMFLDLDNFKVVNDSLGHKAGDQLLVQVSQRLIGCLRTADTAARLGGDEFTVLLEDLSSAADALVVADRIAERLNAAFELDGREVFVTASVGIAVSTGPDDTAESLIRTADLAMYQAKTSGKARYAVFDPEMNDRAWQRLEIETDLRHALDRGEFVLHYQPIVDLASGRIEELEALIRWQHPTRGIVPPNAFIPIAEETGLIVPIGRWVLEQACEQLRGWGNSDLVISVNLAARQFQDPQLLSDVARVLARTGIAPRQLKLEITESAAMHDAAATEATLRQLKALGVGLAIDDFGTGYSALSYLKRFSVDTLKVDRSFVNGIGHNTDDTAIVSAIVALARTMGLEVTAEGVETADQREHLRVLGCNRGQGYYFARPRDRAEVSGLLDRCVLPADAQSVALPVAA
jgi:diguanylate cyclase (GGDEF)-like protein/PAS domain S-box-containing protein